MMVLHWPCEHCACLIATLQYSIRHKGKAAAWRMDGYSKADMNFACPQLLKDKSIDDVSMHRRAEALMEIAQIFEVSTLPVEKDFEMGCEQHLQLAV